MKNLLKIALLAITTFLFTNNTYAQNLMASNGGTYYICIGETYTVQVTPPVAYYIYDGAEWQLDGTSCSNTTPFSMYGYTISSFYSDALPYCTSNATSEDYAVITATSTNSVIVSIVTTECSDEGGGSITFVLIPYVTSIVGPTGICDTTAETYTAAINGGLHPTFTWTLPPFLSGSSSTDVITVTGAATTLAYGNITVTDNGCPSGSASNSATLNVNNVPHAPTSAPGALNYQQHGRSCWWDAYVPSVTNATQYQWSWDSTFATANIFATTGYPVTTNGPFLLDTHTYTFFVRGINECGNGPYSKYIKETPEAPQGCLHRPIDIDTDQNSMPNGYKVYPNPAGNWLTVEYLKPANNAALSFNMYDMLGQKVASWNLQTSENRVSENTSLLPAGLYLYEIVSNNALLARGKIIIQR